MSEVLQRQGKDVCLSDWGRDLGAIFEFKLDDEQDGEDILLRVFCHLYGEQKILVLHGYDKGEPPAARYQNVQIRTAEERLALWQAERRRQVRAARAAKAAAEKKAQAARKQAAKKKRR